MKEKPLQKPTLFHIVFAGCFTVLRDAFFVSRKTLPERIGNYVLVTDVRKNRGYKYSFGLGIYTKNKKKYFIKYWTGRIKDMCYYNLINEYFLANLISQKLAGLPRSIIKAPRVIEYVHTQQSLSIVYEYIEGKSLLSYPEKKRTTVLLESINVLKKISDALTAKEKTYFTKRSSLFYFVSFWPLSLFVLIMNRNYAGTILRSFVRSIRIIFSIPTLRYGIAHRDLDATNVIMAGKHAYLADFESMVVTFSAYDLIWISLSPDIKRLPDTMYSILQKPENIFLRTYILFHLALSANAFPELRTTYIKKLAEYE